MCVEYVPTEPLDSSGHAAPSAAPSAVSSRQSPMSPARRAFLEIERASWRAHVDDEEQPAKRWWIAAVRGAGPTMDEGLADDLEAAPWEEVDIEDEEVTEWSEEMIKDAKDRQGD